MQQCWNFKSSDRPTFHELVERMDNILLATSNIQYANIDTELFSTLPSSSSSRPETTPTTQTESVTAVAMNQMYFSD